jgi:hypothetical protein
LTIATTGDDHGDLVTREGIEQVLEVAFAAIGRFDLLHSLAGSVALRSQSLAARDVRFFERTVWPIIAGQGEPSRASEAAGYLFDFYAPIGAGNRGLTRPQAGTPLSKAEALEFCRGLIRKRASDVGEARFGIANVGRDLGELARGAAEVAERLPVTLVRGLALFAGLR